MHPSHASHQSHLSRLAGLSALVVVGLLGGACSTGTSSTTVPVLTVPPFSLVPARETSTPGPVETPGELPPVGPPSGVPPPPDSVTGYAGPVGNLVAFIAGYRAAFQIPELTDDQIAAAGARLCTYMQGQAGPDGVVDAARALADAEVHEPGYPREAWIAAFEIASTTYCTEFSFDLGEEG